MSLVAIGARLRAICLALPEANEEVMRRGPSYRVGTRSSPSNVRGTTGSRSGARAGGLAGLHPRREPARFFIPPYFGSRGWIGVGLDEAADWREVEAFVQRSYRLVAPKRLCKLRGVRRRSRAGGICKAGAAP